jgi:hypothetical protein
MKEAEKKSSARTKSGNQLLSGDVNIVEPKTKEPGFLSQYDALIAMGFTDEMLIRDIQRLKSSGWIVGKE